MIKGLNPDKVADYLAERDRDRLETERFRAKSRKLRAESIELHETVQANLERIKHRQQEIDLLDSGEYIVIAPEQSADNGRKRPFWKFW